MTDGTEAAAGPPLNRMLTSVLSLIGFFVALYLWAHNAGLTGPIVCGVGDCATVQASQYARIAGVPVSSIGVAGYTVLFVLSLMGLQPARHESKLIAGPLLGGSGG